MGPAGSRQGKVARRSGRPGFRLVRGRPRADLRDESRLGLGGSGPVREESRPGLLSGPGPVRDESRPGPPSGPGPVRDESRPGPPSGPGPVREEPPPGPLSGPGPVREEPPPDLNEQKFGLGVGRGHLPDGFSPGVPAIRAAGSRCSPGRPAHRDMRIFPTARGPGNGRLRWNPRTSWTRRFRRLQRRRCPRRCPYPQRPPYPQPAVSAAGLSCSRPYPYPQPPYPQPPIRSRPYPQPTVSAAVVSAAGVLSSPAVPIPAASVTTPASSARALVWPASFVRSFVRPGAVLPPPRARSSSRSRKAPMRRKTSATTLRAIAI